jgi:hypothetical protein
MFNGASERTLVNALKRHDLNKTASEFGIRHNELSGASWAHLLNVSDTHQRAIEMRHLYVEQRGGKNVVIPDFFERIKVEYGSFDGSFTLCFRIRSMLASRQTVNAWILLEKAKNTAKKTSKKHNHTMGGHQVRCPLCPSSSRLFCADGLIAHTIAKHQVV